VMGKLILAKIILLVGGPYSPISDGKEERDSCSKATAPKTVHRSL
jgi:hypothetical protein